MTASGGKVVAQLILDPSQFSAAWKKVLADLNQDVKPKAADSIKKSLKESEASVSQFGAKYQAVMNKVESISNAVGNRVKSVFDKINGIEFGGIGSKFEAVTRKIESGASSLASKIKSHFDSINNVNFNNISNKFDAVIQRMSSSAKAGASNVKNSFSSMESGISGILGTAGAAIGLNTLFEHGMQKAVTQKMLGNIGRSGFYEGYAKYTKESSTPDTDINRMFQWLMVAPGMKDDLVYRGLSAIDAASYSSDPINRLRDQTAWSKYIQGGWSTAAGAMRDEPLPDDIKTKMKNAKTVEERIAVAEEFARLRGTLDLFGKNLSTITEEELGAFNSALTTLDSIIRATTKAFTDLLVAVKPAFEWFNSLSTEQQNFIGKLILGGVILTGFLGGLKLVAMALSPLWTGISKLAGFLNNLSPPKPGVGTTTPAATTSPSFWATGPGKLISTIAPSSATAYIMGGAQGLGMNIATMLGTAGSSMGGAIAPAIGGLFLPGGIFGRPFNEEEKSRVYDPEAGRMVAPSEVGKGNKGGQLGQWWKENGSTITSSIMNPFGSGTGEGIKWPSSGDILKGIKDGLTPKIPGLTWPGSGRILEGTLTWIKNKIIGVLQLPGMGQVLGGALNWIRGKIGGFLQLPGWGDVLSRTMGWIYSKVSGFLQMPSGQDVINAILSRVRGGGGGLSSAVVQGKLQAAARKGSTTAAARMLYKKPWGPREDLEAYGSNLNYIPYGGHKVDPISALTDGGNCFDMTLGGMMVAGGEMMWGRWTDGNPHVWLKTGGKNYDFVNKALNNNWNPPPQGPGDGGNPTYVFVGDVYGWNDFKRKVAEANGELIRPINRG